MTELEEKIKKYSDAYYKDGSSEISDAEFDALIEELRIVKPESELLSGITGSDLKGVSKKYKLPNRMGTLDKCMTLDEFKDRWNTTPNNDVVVEMKMDGVSTLLKYVDGKFIFAYSRGNSEYAEDITKNVSAIPFPKEIPGFTGRIRAEILMKYSTFEKFFKSEAKNPRNMTAGIVSRNDSLDCDKLSIVAYEVFDDNNVVDNTELSKIEFLMKAGFTVPPIRMFNPDFDTIVKVRNNLFDYGFDYPCDGLVIKQNQVSKEDLERKTPKYNYCFKPAPSIRITKVIDIVWQLAGSILSPVAIVEPIEIDGTIVNRASLSNLKVMETLGVRIGSTVKISKRGMIIPKIEEVVC